MSILSAEKQQKKLHKTNKINTLKNGKLKNNSTAVILMKNDGIIDEKIVKIY